MRGPLEGLPAPPRDAQHRELPQPRVEAALDEERVEEALHVAGERGVLLERPAPREPFHLRSVGHRRAGLDVVVQIVRLRDQGRSTRNDR
jgi:hypothetical protein